MGKEGSGCVWRWALRGWIESIGDGDEELDGGAECECEREGGREGAQQKMGRPDLIETRDRTVFHPLV